MVGLFLTLQNPAFGSFRGVPKPSRIPTAVIVVSDSNLPSRRLYRTVKTDIDEAPPVVVTFLRQGAKYMAGPLPHVQAAENEMLEMKAAAKTNGEIA